VQQVLCEAVKSVDNPDIDRSLRIVLAAGALAKLRPDDFDDDGLRVRWSAVLENLHGVERDHPHGPVADTVSGMSEDRLAAVEREIRELAELVGPMP
jgi:hypothetical protein